MKDDTITLTTVQVAELWTFRSSNGYTSPEYFIDEVSAADAAAKLAVGQKHFAVSIPNHTKDALLAKWQMEGIAAYDAGKPETIWNRYQREGYAARSSAPYLVRGWPTPATVNA